MALEVLALESPATPSPTPSPGVTITPPESVEEATSVLVEAVQDLIDGFVASLPSLSIGLVIVLVGLVVARGIADVAGRGLRRAGGDQVVVSLGQRLTRLLIVIAAFLLALSVAGVPVGAALAGFGIAGLAIAFALQSILENFVSGILLIIRKPIMHGEQVVIGEHEGTVEDIDLRVTRLVDHDGQLVIIPNGEVFRTTIVNLTRRRVRRSRVVVGIDYRDDHEAVGDLLRAAVGALDVVLDTPPVSAGLVALGESSVDVEVRYWTTADIATVVDARDQVLRTVKTAVEQAGMTIPWPIRTITPDVRSGEASPS